MVRSFITAATAAAFVLGLGLAAPVAAAPCKGPGGKFVKCPPPPPAKPQRCRNAKGQMAKCGTPGARVVAK